jgi:hypothetical protein
MAERSRVGNPKTGGGTPADQRQFAFDQAPGDCSSSSASSCLRHAPLTAASPLPTRRAIPRRGVLRPRQSRQDLRRRAPLNNRRLSQPRGSRHHRGTSCASRSPHRSSVLSAPASTPSRPTTSVPSTGSASSSRPASSLDLRARETQGFRASRRRYWATDGPGPSAASPASPSRLASLVGTRAATGSPSQWQAGRCWGRRMPRPRRSLSSGAWYACRREAISPVSWRAFPHPVSEGATTVANSRSHSCRWSSPMGDPPSTRPATFRVPGT